MKKILEQSAFVHISFVLYACLWLIVIYYMFFADYTDSNYAGAIMVEAISVGTLIILAIYGLGFLISGLAAKEQINRKFYLLTALYLSIVPIVLIVLIGVCCSVYYPPV